MFSSAASLHIAIARLASAPKAAEPQLLDIDASVLVMLGIFSVLLLILWLCLWRPYLRVRDERVARVEGARDQATKLEAEAAVRLQRIETALAEARRGGSAEAAKLRQEAHAREQQILAEGHAAARALLADARSKLEAVVAKEKATLQAQTALLARQMAEKTLGRSVRS